MIEPVLKGELMKVRRGTELELDIEKIAYGGQGVARVEGFVVFVKNVLPGQKVLAKITRRRASYAEAIPLEVLRESPWSTQPKCKHFGTCGGCAWQNLLYEKQLAVKTEQVRESLSHIGDVSDVNFLPTVPSPSIYYYRNKLEFTFGPRRWLLPDEIESNEFKKPKNFALGFHAKGHWEKVVDVDECWLQAPGTNEILLIVKEIAEKSGLRPYDTLTHEGFWRFLVVRHSKTHDDFLVNLITTSLTTSAEKETIEKIAGELKETCVTVSSFVHSVSDKKAQIAYGDDSTLIFGNGIIRETLGDVNYSFSVNSFFQTNTEGTKRLYDVVLEFLKPDGNETVWDLYCGAGTISVYVARKVERVIGIELLPEAVKDAERNCSENNITNCVFISGDLKEIARNFENIAERYGKPDAIITDPPRAGMHKDVVKGLLDIGAPKIVGVSCNPTTFSRDVKMLSEKYRLSKMRVVDLFPHTTHMETVGLLQIR
ncbi:MAG TPA: 23S rRNA (uracil(1939)-C(5))-methyltransferase RlmD [Deltaproteobacteria bacterium]|nr:23S rRNA (uracil(1939)-C(5))-methyltransferase RlmD [Deltaproteobacteria bacterium]